MSKMTLLRCCDVSCAGTDGCSGETADGSTASTSKQRAEACTCAGAEEAATHGTLPWIVVVCASGEPE